MAQIDRIGFGQVEPNHLSGIVTGQILAQLPVDKSMGDVIENGRFAKYVYGSETPCVKADPSADGEWMMIYNEEKLYDERYQSHKDFAMVKTNYTDEEMVPRLISILLGDIFTTNTFKEPAKDNVSKTEVGTEGTIAVGDKVYIGDNGYLTKTQGESATPVFQAVKVYTMPDGQPGVKLMRIE